MPHFTTQLAEAKGKPTMVLVLLSCGPPIFNDARNQKKRRTQSKEKKNAHVLVFLSFLSFFLLFFWRGSPMFRPFPPSPWAAAAPRSPLPATWDLSRRSWPPGRLSRTRPRRRTWRGWRRWRLGNGWGTGDGSGRSRFEPLRMGMGLLKSRLGCWVFLKWQVILRVLKLLWVLSLETMSQAS